MTPGSHLTVLPVAEFPGIELAACAGADIDIWFLDVGDTADEAKTICAGCEVRVACLEYALTNHERWGVWGGHTTKERQRILRQRGTP